jgi:hypothetical protein
MGSGKDEYDDVYKQHAGSGFEFVYYKRHLGKSKMVFREAIASIDAIKRNEDDIPLFVRCRECDTYMDFTPGHTGVLDGRWICPSCGARVRERTAYSQLDRENTAYLIAIEREEEPEGCSECGGPWPECQSGCRLFRD